MALKTILEVFSLGGNYQLSSSSRLHEILTHLKYVGKVFKDDIISYAQIADDENGREYSVLRCGGTAIVEYVKLNYDGEVVYNTEPSSHTTVQFDLSEAWKVYAKGLKVIKMQSKIEMHKVHDQMSCCKAETKPVRKHTAKKKSSSKPKRKRR